MTVFETTALQVTGSHINRATKVIREVEKRRPDIALILGSGLGELADDLQSSRSFSTADLPGYPASSVEGHVGELVIGSLEGHVVAVVRGRVHCYEGYHVDQAVLPVSLVHALGANRLIITNAAGGIGPHCFPGSIMLIEDHLNMTGLQPGGAGTHVSESFRTYYDPDWRRLALDIGADLGIAISEGVYAWTLGPSYETKAEISFFARAGAHAVGMSTVPEVVRAHQLGMDVLGISTITNAASGLHRGELSHEDVLAVGATVQDDVRKLIRRLISSI